MLSGKENKRFFRRPGGLYNAKMKNTPKKVRWGIIGPGKIAHKFAEDIQRVSNAELFAVASRSKAKAEAFAKLYNAERAYDNYQLLASDSQVDAVFIATPHYFHMDHTLLCLNHKKAVLCEKPFAMNSLQLREMIETAKTKDTLLMEAMWTIFLPHYQMVLKLIKEGAIGRITGLEADFGLETLYDPESRLFKKGLGGGSLLDIGIYPIFLSLSVLGIPGQIEADATFFDSGADSACNIRLAYENHVEARLQCSFLKDTPTAATIFGEHGKLIIHPRFFAPASFTIESAGKTQKYDFEVKTNGYSFEIEHFSNSLLNGNKESPLMTFRTSNQLIQLLGDMRERIGLKY
jgi:predicted dehydrogenase